MSNTTPDNLVEHLRRGLKACKGEWARLVKVSNGEIKYRWLTAFASGQIKDPGFSKVLALGKFLGARLAVARGPHFNKFEP